MKEGSKVHFSNTVAHFVRLSASGLCHGCVWGGGGGGGSVLLFIGTFYPVLFMFTLLFCILVLCKGPRTRRIIIKASQLEKYMLGETDFEPTDFDCLLLF